MQCGGAAAAVKENSTAFGCRKWEWAIVVTGVWQGRFYFCCLCMVSNFTSGNGEAEVKGWVSDTMYSLLPFSVGVYGVDLGSTGIFVTYIISRLCLFFSKSCTILYLLGTHLVPI